MGKEQIAMKKLVLWMSILIYIVGGLIGGMLYGIALGLKCWSYDYKKLMEGRDEVSKTNF